MDTALVTSPLRIGPLEFGFPVVQAALSGYSDRAMRTIARRLGAPYTLCEVLLDEFVLQVRRRRHLHRWLDPGGAERPIGGQLMGAEPERFGPAARRLVEAGFDAIDINFGCPVKKVLGRCRGGFHLSQPDGALDIVARVRDAVPESVPVTVKMRRGIDETRESVDKFFKIFDGSFARGVAAVTVHGRTVRQRYDGPSSWEFLRQVKRHAGRRTVLGSGDLFTAQACVDMLRTTGVDGASVARGAIGNPWIFSQVKALLAGKALPPPPSLFEQRDVIRDHYALAGEIYGPDRCVPPMRKFGIKYSRLHPDSEQVRDAFVRVKQAVDVHGVLARWYAADLPGRYPTGPNEASDR